MNLKQTLRARDMIPANDFTYRVLADGLIHQAEMLPKKHPAARHLREAAASLLDADMCLSPANDTAIQSKRGVG
ncbi:MAG: hypothetical protein ACK4FB_08045 [Brevundimonas sp.]|uniref:hypothetical protein n=1 Tax=Brevundimonas sp. TaxID=1871086 RepID=UPI003919E78B